MKRQAVWLMSLSLLLAASSPEIRAATTAPVVHVRQSSRLFHALLGPIVFVISESRSDNTPPDRSWSAEELVDSVETMVGGSFAAGDFTFTGRVLQFSSGGYELRCVVTSPTKRDTRSEQTVQRVQSFDHSPLLFSIHTLRTTFIGELDCTLKTPDVRTLKGNGEYEKDFEEDRHNALLP